MNTKGKLFALLAMLVLLSVSIGSFTAFAEDTPPQIEINFGDDDDDDDDDPPNVNINLGGDIEITSASAFPAGFNPLIADTEISYKVNEDAVVDVKILNLTGTTVVTLVSGKDVTGGTSYTTTWNGTNSTGNSGIVVDPGNYTYKVVAKDPSSLEVADTATGTIQIIYNTTPGNTTPGTTTPGTTTPGTTPQTGPGVALYLAVPLAGYIARRKFRK